MKENQFEVIVPAYDALESELEDILGGGCFIHKCISEINCKPNNSGGGNCTRKDEIPPNPQACCPGLVAIKSGASLICAEPA